jgi:iron-sulfur cluster repair protein YtfE (RIC family)
MNSGQTDLSDVGPPRGRFTIVYLIHEAFRRDIKRLSAAVRVPGVTQQRAQWLAGAWAFVDDQLHHHHKVEDASLWPLVRPKLVGRDDDLAVLDEMEVQHVELLPKCAAIGKGLASFAQGPDASAGGDLGDELDALETLLALHLHDEEQRCFPVIDSVLTIDEFESFGKATAKAIGMRGSAKFFPWIFDGADPVERSAVLSMPPPPVRILCRFAWEPRYERTVATMWAASA